MLGSLFKEALSSLTVSSAKATPTTSFIESVQEDIHTRSLIFPDADSLYEHAHSHIFPLTTSHTSIQTSSINAYDINQDIELELKDARIIIMQEATSSVAAALLYDTHAPEVDARESTPKVVATHPIASPRRISIGQPTRPMVISEPPRGAFDRRPSSHMRTASYAETEGQRSAREYREELTTFSGCIFGSSDIMAYKGTGTKVHIIPTEPKSYSSPFSEGLGSLGKSSLRSSRLAQSYTSESIMAPVTSTGNTRALDRKKVLITRIFPVPLANKEADDAKDEYPFPETRPDGTTKARKVKPKQRRTPMYAIAIVLTLPATPASRSSFKPSSYGDQSSSFPTSFNSLKPSGWTVLGEGFGVESLESSIAGDNDDRIDVVTQHWDVIVRTLSHLQTLVSTKIHTMLEEVDVTSPTPKLPTSLKARTGSVSIAGRRVEDTRQPPKTIKMNAKLIQLAPNALCSDEKIKLDMGHAQLRIIHGIKAQPVVTRQNRWGIWRDEARWIAKRAGGKESGFFFYNVLTAFLGTHTEWLQALGPSWYRRRHYQQSRSSKDEDPPLAARTIVVAHDRMAARRLVFLLSAFLAPNQQHQLPYSRTYRPATSHSFGGFSQSPPSYGPNKEESLRRKLNKNKQVHSRTLSTPSQCRSDSDVKSGNLPIPGSDIGTIKNMSATTTSVVPVATIPHFSTRQRVRGTGPVPRPGSSGSLAADDLIRSLKRGDSTGQSDARSLSRWGSVSSWSDKMGFSWNKRRQSSSLTTATLEEEEPLKSTLAKMVEDARITDAQKLGVGYEIPEPYPREHANPIPYQSPIKSSVNEDDGVIEVDVPLPDFLSPFGSAISSPSSSGYLSVMGPGLEGFEHYGRGSDGDPPLNVGGWLPRFHPDFSLQAIAAQDGLLEEVKGYMRAEPTPATDRANGNHWIDITSTLIVDTTNFTVKRLKYRRFITVDATAAATPDRKDSNVSDAQIQFPATSQYGNPYLTANGQPTPVPDAKVEDQFTEDYVLSIDPMLIDAVEKIIAQHAPLPISTTTSTSSDGDQGSRASSRSATREGGGGKARATSRNSDETQTHSAARGRQVVEGTGIEVPRGECKKCILGALEDIASHVAEARNNDAKEKNKDDDEGEAARLDSRAQADSILKEGVTSWLVAVENAA